MTGSELNVAGPTVLLERDLCKGCGLCIDVCPPGVLRQDAALNHLGFHPVAYLGRWCNACGLCFFACPEPGAITVVRPGRSRRADAVIIDAASVMISTPAVGTDEAASANGASRCGHAR